MENVVTLEEFVESQQYTGEVMCACGTTSVSESTLDVALGLGVLKNVEIVSEVPANNEREYNRGKGLKFTFEWQGKETEIQSAFCESGLCLSQYNKSNGTMTDVACIKDTVEYFQPDENERQLKYLLNEMSEEDNKFTCSPLVLTLYLEDFAVGKWVHFIATDGNGKINDYLLGVTGVRITKKGDLDYLDVRGNTPTGEQKIMLFEIGSDASLAITSTFDTFYAGYNGKTGEYWI